jgi:Na+/melibiose symporter-like transporter
MVGDGLAMRVIGFVVVVVVGVALTASLQVYVYEHFLCLKSDQKTLAHSAAIFGLALGAFLASSLVRRIEKRAAVMLGTLMNLGCNGVLGLVLLTGWFDLEGHLTVALFTILNAFYWVGHGIMIPVSTSMLADLSELERLRCGRAKDGLYASAFSFSRKAGISGGIFISGMALNLSGFVQGQADPATPEVAWRLCASFLFLGPLISTLGLALIMQYPVDRRYLAQARAGT